jgi:hypothetical protein
MCALVLDQRHAIGEQLGQPPLGAGVIVHGRDIVNPCPELVTIAVRDPEQLADHQDRQRQS